MSHGHGNADQLGTLSLFQAKKRLYIFSYIFLSRFLGPYFESIGYTKSSSPSLGAIAVFQPCFGGVDPNYGHVAIIASFKTSPTVLQIRGANQG